MHFNMYKILFTGNYCKKYLIAKHYTRNTESQVCLEIHTHTTASFTTALSYIKVLY